MPGNAGPSVLIRGYRLVRHSDGRHRRADAGLDQIVLLCTGLDGRAYRLSGVAG